MWVVCVGCGEGTLAETSSVRVLILSLTLTVRRLICPLTKSSRSFWSSRSSRQQILSEERWQETSSSQPSAHVVKVSEWVFPTSCRPRRCWWRPSRLWWPQWSASLSLCAAQTWSSLQTERWTPAGVKGYQLHRLVHLFYTKTLNVFVPQTFSQTSGTLWVSHGNLQRERHLQEDEGGQIIHEIFMSHLIVFFVILMFKYCTIVFTLIVLFLMRIIIRR